MMKKVIVEIRRGWQSVEWFWSAEYLQHKVGRSLIYIYINVNWNYKSLFECGFYFLQNYGRPRKGLRHNLSEVFYKKIPK